MDSAGGTMSAVPQTDGQARLPKRIAPTGKVLKRKLFSLNVSS